MKMKTVYTKLLKLSYHVFVMLIVTVIVGVIGLSAYNEGYTNGEEEGSLVVAQYVATQCYKGSNLQLFGVNYYCSRYADL